MTSTWVSARLTSVARIYVDKTKCGYATVKERSYEKNFVSRYQEGEEKL